MNCPKKCDQCQCSKETHGELLSPIGHEHGRYKMYKTIELIKNSPVASDTLISAMCKDNEKPLFVPYVHDKVSKDVKDRGIPSYGLSSTGYDLRCDGEVLVFKGTNDSVVDPRKVDSNLFERLEVMEDDTGKYVLIPPRAFVLAASLEWVNIPRTHMGIVNTKSTYARSGLQTLTTPLESNWSGIVTLEFVNNTTSFIKLYTEGGLVQVNLLRSEGVEKDYIERGGKYQEQTGITHARS